MSAELADMNLIDVVGLKKYFPIRAGLLKRAVGSVKAVDDVNFYIKKGETLGLVGESGCGKTTVGRSIMMLTPPTEGCVFLETPKVVVATYRELEFTVRTIRQGRMTAAQAAHIADLVETLFSEKSCDVSAAEKRHLCEDAKKVRVIASKHGGNERIKEEDDIRDLVKDALEEVSKRYCINFKKKSQVKRLRSRIQFVFQDPFSSLDPKMLIKDIVSEPLKSQARMRRKQDAVRLMALQPTSAMSQHSKRVQLWYSKLPDEEKKVYLDWYVRLPEDARKNIVATDFGRIRRTSDHIKKTVPPPTVPPEIAFRYHEAQQWYSKLKDDERRRIVATDYGKVKKSRKDIDATVPPTAVPFKVMTEYHEREARISKGEQIRREVIQLMERVGLNVEHMYRFPHEFSGGQRQRIGIARALSVNPDFVVLDEPTSALDVSVQAQILNMLNQLQNDFGLTYLFISHDLSIIRYMCDRVAVMYLGKIVEYASKEELFARPTHPYTEALLSVIPIPDPELKKDRIILPGDVPSPANPPSGCRFHTRCPLVIDICHSVDPPLTDRGNEHFVACHVR